MRASWMIRAGLACGLAAGPVSAADLFGSEPGVAYDLPEIRRWLGVFLGRYFGFSQFKRSALPNGPKVSAGGSLSPRGDWRAPSDGSARIWIEELNRNVPET